MKTVPPEKNITCRITTAAAISIVTFITLYAIRMPFLTDNFLISDDLIYIPKWLIEGFHIAEQGILVFAKFLSFIFILFQEPGLLRIAFIFIFSLAIGFFSFALFYEFSALTLTLFALLSALIQMGVDQAMFIVGSYAILGTSLVLTAFSFIYLSSQVKKNPLALMITGYFFTTLAQLVHPTFSLIPLAFLVLTPVFNKKYAVLNIICIALSYFTRFFLISTYTYHYSKKKGWVSYSIDNILTQVERSVTYVWSTITIDGKILVALLFCTGFILLLNRLRKGKSNSFDKNKAIVALFFLILSIFTFGPTSILNGTTSRYLYAPQLFLLISLMLFTAAMAQKGYEKLIVNILLSLLCISFYINTQEFYKNRFTELQQTQRVIKECLNEQYPPAAASPNDQIIILMDHMPRSFTGAYNHWSTWFLRYQTGNKNLIGLVGPKSFCHANPIVEKYKDHDDEYWDVRIIKGKETSYRITMKGLEIDRNTFAFEETDDGFTPIPFLIIPAHAGSYYIAKHGKTFQTVSSDDPALQKAEAVGFFWPID